MRCATGESWHLIMFDLAMPYSPTNQCSDDETYESVMANGGVTNGCGSPFFSFFFFLTFQVLVSQIFVNLFIAIIIDAFLGQSDQFKLPVSVYSVYEFTNLWANYDPEATGFISIDDLESFIIDLAESEGRQLVIFHKRVLADADLRRRFLTKLNIPTYHQMRKVNFTDTLQQLCDKVNLLNFKTQNT